MMVVSLNIFQIKPRVLKIPLVCIMVIRRETWSILKKYYVTQKYDPSDEHRKPIDFWGRLEN